MNDPIFRMPVFPSLEMFHAHLERALFYSLMYAAQENCFDEAIEFIYEHMDTPIPFEILCFHKRHGRNGPCGCYPREGGTHDECI